jgi:hypothetical protein
MHVAVQQKIGERRCIERPALLRETHNPGRIEVGSSARRGRLRPFGLIERPVRVCTSALVPSRGQRLGNPNNPNNPNGNHDTAERHVAAGAAYACRLA